MDMIIVKGQDRDNNDDELTFERLEGNMTLAARRAWR